MKGLGCVFFYRKLHQKHFGMPGCKENPLMMINYPFLTFDDGRRVKNVMTTKMMIYFWVIFTVFSLVKAANFNVTGVEYRLLTTLMNSAWATLCLYESDRSVISVEGKIWSFDGRSWLGNLMAIGGGKGRWTWCARYCMNIEKLNKYNFF